MKLKRLSVNNEIFDFYTLFLLTPNCDINATRVAFTEVLAVILKKNCNHQNKC